jgi:hypothetical protein
LKKSLQICENLNQKKKKYKGLLMNHKDQLQLAQEKLEAAHGKIANAEEILKITQKRLDLIEKFVGLEELDMAELELMEKFHYRGLDVVKNIKFQKNIRERLKTLGRSLKKNINVTRKIWSSISQEPKR